MDVVRIAAVVIGCLCACASSQDDHHEYTKEYHPYDGWYNNRAHPEWGSADGPLTRRTPSHYADGVYAPSGSDRPNPRLVSQETMAGVTGHGSHVNRTALLVFFGQQVVEEILDAQRPGCPPEYFNIKIPKGDPLYDPHSTGTVEIPLLRSRYDMGITGYSPNNPRQQLNEITPWIDGGLTYGVVKAWADALRLLKSDCPSRLDNPAYYFRNVTRNITDCRGELASVDEMGKFPIHNDIGLPLANPPPPRDNKLKSSSRFYRLGNPRGNENPFLLTFGVLWFRYHNYLAMKLRESHPTWSDERVYNEARIRNIATHQKIVLYDWLPLFLGECETRHGYDPDPELSNITCRGIPAYSGYKSAIHPGITHVFQSAAMRFGHTLVPPGVFRRSKVKSDDTCEYRNTSAATAGDLNDHTGRHGLRTCNTYWNSVEAVGETDIDALLMGMASQICEREDNIITPDLRGSVFGFLDFIRRDLMAINIQRGRDHGLPDYNTARVSYGMKAHTRFEDINPVLFADAEGQALLARLKAVHNDSLHVIDVWTGGLMETQPQGPGELFREIIRDQFVRIRDGDRFWFENKDNGLFDDADLREIWATDIRDVILRVNPNMGERDIQFNPFQFNGNVSENEFCGQPYQLNETDMEECTPPSTFDYFTGSEVSYALTFASFGVFTIATVLFMFYLGSESEKTKARMKKRIAATNQRQSLQSGADQLDLATELTGDSGNREIQLKLGPGKTIQVRSVKSKLLRTIDLSKSDQVLLCLAYNGGRRTMFLRADKDTHDLVVNFNDEEERNSFAMRATNFFQATGVQYLKSEVSSKQLMLQAKTKKNRDDELKKFFKTALAATIKMKTAGVGDEDIMNSKEARKFIHVELNKREFADYLKLKPDSMFVDQMFNTADIDGSGAISFREFLDIMILFTKGSPQDKSKLMFNMYDLDKSGIMDIGEFRSMLRSMMEMVNASVEADKLDDLVTTMMNSHGFGSKQELTLDDFQKLLQEYNSELSDASLNLPGVHDAKAVVVGEEQSIPTGRPTAVVRETRGARARQTVKRYTRNNKAQQGNIRSRSNRKTQIRVDVVEKKYQKEGTLSSRLLAVENYIQNYRLHIFWLTGYILVLCGIFIERAYVFSVEREHVGLRTIASHGVSITRGAASAMMFTYSCLLVTMARNTITLLRETFLHRYVPFDSAITMHRIIAWLALLFTACHIIGHSMNIYSISTQPIGDLACLFRDYWRTSDTLPKFHYWCWQTITGVTGVVLTLIIIIMFTFASDYARRTIFRWFWWTHQFGYVLVYAFMCLHGSGFLVQDPFFYYFFLGPAVLYTLDKLYSLSGSKQEISVVNAELLPSDVTYLEFKRPPNFDYRAGQWVRIACLAQSPNEYHPFTLTSAPSEDTLKLHIRAVGPWTINLRSLYNPDVLRDSPYPKVYVEGPFGEGHQDWYKYKVAVLVGGGIGVTPFAAILKDLISKTRLGTKIACEKVYFIWVTRDQKQYEWLTEIIQEVENEDERGILDTHIFITQFPQKFDLRTTMLYICERHFQKVAGKSLFTGLRAVTHFGRPDFTSFFNSLTEEHTECDKFGVFSCGPPPMTNGVEKSCATLNKYEGPAFIHHYENF